MRKVVAYENALDNDWFILYGALLVEKDQVPVVWNFDYEKAPIGIATNLQRDEEWGEVSFEIELFDGHIPESDCDFLSAGVFVSGLLQIDYDGVHEIRSGTIRCVSIVPGFAGIRRAFNATEAHITRGEN